jgi:hypothetical protein
MARSIGHERTGAADRLLAAHRSSTCHLPRGRRVAGTLRRRRYSAPLLPARMGSLRSVSVILTSPPQQDKRARSGSLQLHSAQGKGGGYKSKSTGGNPEPPPAPENHGPGSRFPPDPLPASTQKNEGPRRTGDRGRCKHKESAASVRPWDM